MPPTDGGEASKKPVHSGMETALKPRGAAAAEDAWL